ncbi:MAG: hypothetical protein ACI9MC_003411, partial [Kiritimatiellia bacterium]
FAPHPRGAVPARRFDTPGDVRVQCNKHDDMETHVLVVPNAWAVTVDKDGNYSISGITPGPHEVEAWSAWYQPKRTTFNCAPGGVVTFSAKLRSRVPAGAEWDSIIYYK